MPLNLKGRSVLTLMDFTPQEIRYLLDLSRDLKSKKRAGICNSLLKGKSIVLLFEKTSTRTRCAFEVAAAEEGACVTFLDHQSSQFGKKESLEDTAKVLGRFYDGIEYRGYEQRVVEELARHSGVPVYNGLTDIDHPTQILADLMTMEEHIKKSLYDMKVVFAGDISNNVAFALMSGCAIMGMHYVAFGPKELSPDMTTMEKVSKIAKQTGATITISDDINSICGADVIYTDVWLSMGEDLKKKEKTIRELTKFRVSMDMIKATRNPHLKFMHCLPALHDFETLAARQAKEFGYDVREVTDEVFRSSHSIVFDQAENRMHSTKAVLVATLI